MKTKLFERRMIIHIPLLREPRTSQSGKSKLIATTRGPRKAPFTVLGTDVYVAISAYILNDPLNEGKTVGARNHKPKTRQRKPD